MPGVLWLFHSSLEFVDGEETYRLDGIVIGLKHSIIHQNIRKNVSDNFNGFKLQDQQSTKGN